MGRRRKRDVSSEIDFGNRNVYSRLTGNHVEAPDKPRESFGRVAPITRQNHVSVTVKYSKLEHCRTKDKKWAIEGTWIDDGEQQPELIYRARRGEVVIAPATGPSYSSMTMSNLPVMEVTTTLNRLDKRIPYRVVGIAENPGASRGSEQSILDPFGVVQARGSNTIVNTGSYRHVYGDFAYALLIPETVKNGGVTYSGIAIRGTGNGGSGERANWNQKLLPRLIPLKTRSLHVLLNQLSAQVQDMLYKAWPSNKIHQHVEQRADARHQFLQSFRAESIHYIPGLERWAELEFCVQSLNRVWDQYTANVNRDGCLDALYRVYDEGHALLHEYWTQQLEEFKLYNDPDSLVRLHCDSGKWLIPMGIQALDKLAERAPRAKEDLRGFKSAAEIENESSIPKHHARVHRLRDYMKGTQDWLVANDCVTFMDNHYVGMVLSPEAMPGSEMNILR